MINKNKLFLAVLLLIDCIQSSDVGTWKTVKLYRIPNESEHEIRAIKVVKKKLKELNKNFKNVTEKQVKEILGEKDIFSKKDFFSSNPEKFPTTKKGIFGWTSQRSQAEIQKDQDTFSERIAKNIDINDPSKKNIYFIVDQQYFIIENEIKKLFKGNEKLYKIIFPKNDNKEQISEGDLQSISKIIIDIVSKFHLDSSKNFKAVCLAGINKSSEFAIFEVFLSLLKGHFVLKKYRNKITDLLEIINLPETSIENISRKIIDHYNNKCEKYILTHLSNTKSPEFFKRLYSIYALQTSLFYDDIVQKIRQIRTSKEYKKNKEYLCKKGYLNDQISLLSQHDTAFNNLVKLTQKIDDLLESKAKETMEVGTAGFPVTETSEYKPNSGAPVKPVQDEQSPLSNTSVHNPDNTETGPTQVDLFASFGAPNSAKAVEKQTEPSNISAYSFKNNSSEPVAEDNTNQEDDKESPKSSTLRESIEINAPEKAEISFVKEENTENKQNQIEPSIILPDVPLTELEVQQLTEPVLVHRRESSSIIPRRNSTNSINDDQTKNEFRENSSISISLRESLKKYSLEKESVGSAGDPIEFVIPSQVIPEVDNNGLSHLKENQQAKVVTVSTAELMREETQKQLPHIITEKPIHIDPKPENDPVKEKKEKEKEKEEPLKPEPVKNKNSSSNNIQKIANVTGAITTIAGLIKYLRSKDGSFLTNIKKDFISVLKGRGRPGFGLASMVAFPAFYGLGKGITELKKRYSAQSEPVDSRTNSTIKSL